jgi:hypothetical protein
VVARRTEFVFHAVPDVGARLRQQRGDLHRLHHFQRGAHVLGHETGDESGAIAA